MKNATMVVIMVLMATLLTLSSNVLGDSEEFEFRMNSCNDADREFRTCIANCTDTGNCSMYDECMTDCWLNLSEALAKLVYGDD